MKKLLHLFSYTFLLFILLAGCGSTSEKPTGNEQINKSDNPSANTNNNSEEDNDQIKENEINSNETENEKEIRSKEKKIISKGIDGKETESTAQLTESDIQNYSMYVLTGFELTGEEPHKDVLYSTENDSHFMRIELLPVETNMEDAIHTIKEQLTAVSNEVNEVQTKDRSDWLKNAYIYKTENKEESVSAFLIKQNDWLLKLTIFTTLNEDFEDPFLKMAETIQAKE